MTPGLHLLLFSAQSSWAGVQYKQCVLSVKLINNTVNTDTLMLNLYEHSVLLIR